MSVNMKYLYRGIVVFIVFINCLGSFGQWNIQTGYDIGVIRFPSLPELIGKDINRKTDFNFLHRYNLLGEYKLSNNMVTSLTFGFDNFRNKFDFTTTEVSEASCIEKVSKNEYFAIVNTLRFDLSLGYSFKLSNKSNIVLKGNYGMFIIANHKIFNSTRTTIEENKCLNYTEIRNNVMLDFLNVNHKYGEGIKTGWNQVSISAEYRYKIKDFNVNVYSAFSPMLDKEFIVSTTGYSKNLIFILGLRLGYTLPQKNKNNEK